MTQETKEHARQTDLEGVLAALTSNDRFLVVTHENPDGDALGSMLASPRAARARQGRRHVPLRRRAAARRVRLPPARATSDASCRTTSRSACCSPLDCANERRHRPRTRRSSSAPIVVNVDHHHDNTRFGDINLIVDDASSTAEIVRDVLRGSTCTLTPEIAEALYVALVTDTGRFQYSNTTPKALRLAAELVEAGADVHGIFQQRLRDGAVREAEAARAGARAGAALRGRAPRRLVPPARADFAEVGAEEPYSEGIIDYLRAGRGRRDGRAHPRAAARRRAGAPHLAALEPRRGRRLGDRPAAGGGGHRQAAGFSSELSIDEIIEFIRREFVAATAARGRPDAAAGELSRSGSPSSTSRPGRRRSRSSPTLRRRTGARTGPRGHARPVRDRAARAAVRRGDAARALLRRPRQALRDRRRPDRDDVDRRPRGRGARAPRRRRGRRSTRCSSGLRGEVELPIPAASAVKIGGERAYQLARRGDRGRDAAAALAACTRSTCSRRDERERHARPARQLRDLRPLDRGRRSAGTARRCVGPRSARFGSTRPTRDAASCSRSARRSRGCRPRRSARARGDPRRVCSPLERRCGRAA